jgi:putative hydrolase of the HAD superfamily
VNDSIRTILFDFDGTLVSHKPDSFEVIRGFCFDIGQPLGTETEIQLRRARHKYFVQPALLNQPSGFSPERFWYDFYRYLLEAGSIQGDLDGLARELTGRAADQEFVYHCSESTYQTLAVLRAKGYGLGLITNRHDVQRFHELLDEMELWSYFDLILASGEVGIRKPDPGIFHAALERVDTAAGQAIYIGDNYWADAVGAWRAGVQPILVDPHRLFPEADCPILDRVHDLLAWLP